MRGRVRIIAPQVIRPGTVEDGLWAQDVDVIPHLLCAMPDGEAISSSLCWVASLSTQFGLAYHRVKLKSIFTLNFAGQLAYSKVTEIIEIP